MRILSNFLINGAILFCASWFLPEIVQIDGLETLIIVTLCFGIISVIYEAIGYVFVVGGVFSFTLSLTIVGALMIAFSDILAMTYLSNHLEGFMVVGFLPKIILAALCSSLRIRNNNARYF